MLAPQRFLVLGGFGALVLLLLVYYNSHDHGYSIQDLTRLHSTDSTLRKNVANLFAAVRQPIDADYVDASGKRYARPTHLTWPKPLGKKVLIVDIDTRVPDGDNELMGNKTFEWEKHQSVAGGLVTNGIMNHYLYAQIHGYDYKYYQAQPMPGYYNTWIRPHILASLLRDYDFVITLDADVTSTHLEVPFEWLFNKWNITKRTSIAMPWDVEEQRPNGEVVSTDSKGVQVFNAGFVIVQKLPLTFEMLREWGDCPLEKRYPGCKHWMTNWSHEQRAFSEYIRYDYNPQGDNIVPIPCDDAMSWPNATDEYPGRIISSCHGNFFRHHTLNKLKPKDEFQNSVMQLVGQILQKEVKQDLDKIWVKESQEKEKQKEAKEATIA